MMRKRNIVTVAINTHNSKNTPKYVIYIPTSVEHAYKLTRKSIIVSGNM